jgi:hypothetical protein
VRGFPSLSNLARPCLKKKEKKKEGKKGKERKREEAKKKGRKKSQQEKEIKIKFFSHTQKI